MSIFKIFLSSGESVSDSSDTSSVEEGISIDKKTVKKLLNQFNLNSIVPLHIWQRELNRELSFNNSSYKDDNIYSDKILIPNFYKVVKNISKSKNFL